jgi:hypothetical protein
MLLIALGAAAGALQPASTPTARTPTASTPASASVEGWLLAEMTVGSTMLPQEAAVAKDIRFTSALCKFNGADEYCASATRWHTESCASLLDYQTKVLRVAPIGEDEVSVRWRVEWSADSSRWLVFLARAVGWKIVRSDVDPRVLSQFSWGKVGQLFATALSTGTLRLPASAVEGTARLTLAKGEREIVAHRETIDLVDLADSGALLNRRSAQDVATFLDFRRPASADPDAWAGQVRARVLSGVPGAGPLDIEPMADEREGLVALTGFAVLMSVALAASLAIGLGGDHGATGLAGEWGASVCDEIGSPGDMGYNQCVSDLYT